MKERRLLYAAASTAAAVLLAWTGSARGAAELDCVIQAHQTVTVSAPVEGVAETVRFDRGDYVEAGSVLALLESRSERAALAVAKARTEPEHAIKSNQVRLDFGVRRLQRTDEMFRKDLVPLKDLDEAKTAKILAEHGVEEARENKRLADLEYDQAKAALELRTVKSPITGVVLERLRNVGENATREHPIAKIVQLDPLYVEVYAPLWLFGKLKLGQRLVVVPESPLDTPVEAKVKVIDKVVDTASATFGVRLEAPNPGGRLPAGLKCKVRLPSPKP